MRRTYYAIKRRKVKCEAQSQCAFVDIHLITSGHERTFQVFGLFGRRSENEDAAMELYRSVVEQARDPYFYAELGVPDTPDGRFDMILMHAFLLLQRIKSEGSETEKLGQAFFDLMFDDMDKNLREMGAGDVGISHRIKDMAKAFYGRIAAYEEGLRGSAQELDEAIGRNVFRNADVATEHPSNLATYMRAQVAALVDNATADIVAGRLEFSPLTEIFGPE